MRSVSTTGCTVDALEVPMNMADTTSAPMMFWMVCAFPLCHKPPRVIEPPIPMHDISQHTPSPDAIHEVTHDLGAAVVCQSATCLNEGLDSPQLWLHMPAQQLRMLRCCWVQVAMLHREASFTGAGSPRRVCERTSGCRCANRWTQTGGPAGSWTASCAQSPQQE